MKFFRSRRIFGEPFATLFQKIASKFHQFFVAFRRLLHRTLAGVSGQYSRVSVFPFLGDMGYPSSGDLPRLQPECDMPTIDLYAILSRVDLYSISFKLFRYIFNMFVISR